jgi:hypothetical protein
VRQAKCQGGRRRRLHADHRVTVALRSLTTASTSRQKFSRHSAVQQPMVLLIG